jgi:two-component system chemotaxis sensor kinase CheA
MNDFLEQFLIESREFVAQASDGLLVLEKNPRDAETLDTVFRAFHTLKGGAGIVEFTAMENALHSTETLLQDARAGKRTLDPPLVDDCLASLDQVSRWLDTLERTGELPVTPIASSPIAASPAPQERSSGVEVSLPDIVRNVLREQLAILDVKEQSGADGRLASAGKTAANALRFCGLPGHAENLALAVQQALAQGSNQILHAAIARLLAPDSMAAPAAAAPLAAASPAAASPAAPAILAPRETGARTLRVNAEQIDALVRLTGELTVAKNAIGHAARLAETNGDSTAALLKDHHAGLTRLMAQLQNYVIGMRVLPLSTVFQRFPRVLREMSAGLGKPAQIKVEGEDTEGDKTIVEMLFEPLLHVVRNAVDHGIEDAERRRAAGKPPVATILLRAARDGEQILIEVSDDGRGIDLERVREVARDRGIATEEELRTMPESEVVDLVFQPGFSTAARVTELSGRGVGMDAVRTAVEKVGGRVSIASRADQGTRVSFSLPYSVMMTQVMTVEAGGQVFGIPLEAVVETISLPSTEPSGVGDARVIVQRNRTIPLIDLGSVLHAVPEKTRRERADLTVIIVSIAGQLVGLQVDEVGERMEIMLKPLDGLLSGTAGIAGTTVLGDGRVLLVLDILGILQ